MSPFWKRLAQRRAAKALPCWSYWKIPERGSDRDLDIDHAVDGDSDWRMKVYLGVVTSDRGDQGIASALHTNVASRSPAPPSRHRKDGDSVAGKEVDSRTAPDVAVKGARIGWGLLEEPPPVVAVATALDCAPGAGQVEAGELPT
ncbi:hypothetical protein LNKW23_37050 [Paralimibaculum aggregatum]|uniref:Uncharacterized protein n=1 Tax=Paralimibaculum aggregatum TaxID=3036245 RepID=A0ABQ6LPQ7_9RHOB|nr:hypothetical protein LNKW23_37050 [Limibaculum sp. NKW23]